MTGRWGIPLDGRKMTSLRGVRMITRQELAQLAGVSLDTVSKVENGARRVSPAILAGLIKALGCTPDRLFVNDSVNKGPAGERGGCRSLVPSRVSESRNIRRRGLPRDRPAHWAAAPVGGQLVAGPAVPAPLNLRVTFLIVKHFAGQAHVSYLRLHDL